MATATYLGGDGYGTGSSQSLGMWPTNPGVTANRLNLLFVINSRAAGATLPSVSGSTLTWTQVGTVTSADGTIRITVFRNMVGSNNSESSATVTYGGTSQDTTAGSFIDVSGVVTTGTNGADAIQQFVSATGVDAVVNLAAYEDADNVTVAGSNINGSNGGIDGAGFTNLGQSSNVNPAVKVSWLDGQDTTVTFTGLLAQGTAVAIEVRVPAPPGIASDYSRHPRYKIAQAASGGRSRP